MQIRTLSIVAGSMACNARCPGCIAGMTPRNGIGTKEPEVNWRNFQKVCRLAEIGGCTTAMITSKGEPTLFPKQITRFLREMAPFNFPVIELQTNGSLIAEGKRVTDEDLYDWYDLGLTTVAVSVVSYDAEKNRQIYFPYKKSYFDLPALVEKLHKFGFGVRLTTILAAGFLDSVEEVEKLLSFAREHKIEQLTCTPLTKPDESENADIYSWTAKHQLSDEQWNSIKEFVNNKGHLLQQLEHGARVFDLNGQNICLSNCITVQPDARELRSVIFYPDGTVRSAWQHSGSQLFSGFRRFEKPTA